MGNLERRWDGKQQAAGLERLSILALPGPAVYVQYNTIQYNTIQLYSSFRKLQRLLALFIQNMVIIIM